MHWCVISEQCALHVLVCDINPGLIWQLKSGHASPVCATGLNSGLPLYEAPVPEVRFPIHLFHSSLFSLPTHLIQQPGQWPAAAISAENGHFPSRVRVQFATNLVSCLLVVVFFFVSLGFVLVSLNWTSRKITLRRSVTSSFNISDITFGRNLLCQHFFWWLGWRGHKFFVSLSWMVSGYGMRFSLLEPRRWALYDPLIQVQSFTMEY